MVFYHEHKISESEYCVRDFLVQIIFQSSIESGGRIRAPNSSSGTSVQQSVGSNPGRETCVPKQGL